MQPPRSYAWPTPPAAPLTHMIRNAGLQAQVNRAGSDPQLVQTFAELRNNMTNDNFISALGKYSVDDPAKIDRLALANLRENKHARNDLSALHAARSCLYGSRQLGDRKWFSDKPGIARRLKNPRPASPISDRTDRQFGVLQQTEPWRLDECVAHGRSVGPSDAF